MTTIKAKYLMGEMLKFNIISKYNALLSPTPLSEHRAFAKVTNDTKPQTPNPYTEFILGRRRGVVEEQIHTILTIRRYH